MVRDYTSDALRARCRQRRGDARRRRRHAASRWPTGRATISGAWAGCEVLDIDIDPSAAHEGDQRNVRAHVELGGLDAGEVTVQALHGPIDSTGAFIDTPAAVTAAAAPAQRRASRARYVVGEAGPYGVTVRAVPRHDDLISPMEMGLGRLGRLIRPARAADLRAGEFGLARPVLEEALHTDLAVRRCGRFPEQVALELQRRQPTVARYRRRRPA